MQAAELKILERLEKIKVELKDVQDKFASAKKRVMEIESIIVETKIAKEKAEEELRVFRHFYPEPEKSLVELDIERFRLALPGLLKKLEDE